MIYTHVLNRPGLSVNPVRKDVALTRPFYEELNFYLYYPRHEWLGFLTGLRARRISEERKEESYYMGFREYPASVFLIWQSIIKKGDACQDTWGNYSCPN
jgi:hypothetical protein